MHWLPSSMFWCPRHRQALAPRGSPAGRIFLAARTQPGLSLSWPCPRGRRTCQLRSLAAGARGGAAHGAGAVRGHTASTRGTGTHRTHRAGRAARCLAPWHCRHPSTLPRARRAGGGSLLRRGAACPDGQRPPGSQAPSVPDNFPHLFPCQHCSSTETAPPAPARTSRPAGFTASAQSPAARSPASSQPCTPAQPIAPHRTPSHPCPPWAPPPRPPWPCRHDRTHRERQHGSGHVQAQD